MSQVTLGKTLYTRNVGAFTVTDTMHLPGLRLTRHMHENTSLQVIMKGSFLEKYQGKIIECEASSFTVKPPAEPHSNLFGTNGAHSLIIEIDNSLVQESEDYKILQQMLHIKDASICHLIFNLYKELKNHDPASKLAMEGIIMEIIAHLSRNDINETKMPDWLNQVRDYIHDNYANTITLDTLANLVNINSAHLCRVFRKYLGCSFGDYLREVRFKNAVERITKGEQPLSEIAIECGFYDQSHLNRFFKLKTGQSPNQFQRMVRKGKV